MLFSFSFSASKHFSIKPIQTKTLSFSLCSYIHVVLWTPATKPQPKEEEEDESSKPQSKKATKKEAAKLEKLKRHQEAAVASGVQSLSMEDPLADNYGDVPILDLQSKVALGTTVWIEIGKLAKSLNEQQLPHSLINVKIKQLLW